MQKTIVILCAVILLFTACDEKSKKAIEEAKTVVTETVKEDTQEALKMTKKVVEDATEKTKKKATELADAAKSEAEKIVAVADEKTTKMKETVQKKADEVKNVVKEAVTQTNELGVATYVKCATCHGIDGKTKALGKSTIVAGQPMADLEAAIKGYQEGTRDINGMGMLMKSQVSSLNDEEIKAVSEYMSNM